MSLKHRKKRNAALVYEFLVRRLASTMVDRDPDSYLKALTITKKYYSAGQPLAMEKALFDVVTRSRGMSEQSARRVLQEVKKHACNFDQRLLEIKKSNLIKDLNYAFGPEFYSVHRISEYRLLASLQMLVDRYRNSDAPLHEDVEKIGLEESLISYMKSSVGTKGHQQVEKVDSFVAALAMKKFEERYAGVLSESQRTILRKFMNFSMTGNTEQFRREMTSEKNVILERLTKARHQTDFLEDKVMLARLDESVQKLEGLSDVTTDSAVQDILLYQRLLQEIDSND